VKHPVQRREPAGPAGSVLTPGRTTCGNGQHGPVIVLSYNYSGARRVQDVLAAGGSLGCTSGTGVIPLCEMAAESWRRVEGQTGQAMSQLAVSSIRALVMAQVTTILAVSGQNRWCELAAAPSAAGFFQRVIPDARFVCVHRASLDVIRSAVQANPWGLPGPGLLPYLLSYPGNNVAALAAYWASSTEQLLAFETANPGVTHRIRYEDSTADRSQTLATVRAALGLNNAAVDGTAVLPSGPPETAIAEPPPSAPVIPAEMIPEPLREHISRLHADLGYPPLDR
jgi:hypothetical protein